MPQLLDLETQYHEAQQKRKRHWLRESRLRKSLKEQVEAAWQRADQARKSVHGRHASDAGCLMSVSRRIAHTQYTNVLNEAREQYTQLAKLSREQVQAAYLKYKEAKTMAEGLASAKQGEKLPQDVQVQRLLCGSGYAPTLRFRNL
mgnify:CR=1 FL=1